MNPVKLNLHAPWEEVKERLKENDIPLTDDDLQYEPGREDQLLERLAAKMKKTKEEVKSLIESISSNERMAG